MAFEGDSSRTDEDILGVLIDIRLLLRKLVVLSEEGMGFQVNDDDVDN